MMKNSLITPVILCGGSGTRLWPRSRASKPKPFLPLVGEGTLFEQTLRRCTGDAFAPAVVITHERHLSHVEQALTHFPRTQVIVEPEPKNTATAIAMAALRLPDDCVMLVTPSDHHIGDSRPFLEAALSAAQLARERWLVAIGVAAKSPNTGFGYIQRGAPLRGTAFQIHQFVEKPDLATAKSFVESGHYCWNAGIFAFTPQNYLRELAEHRPQIAETARLAAAAGRSDGYRFHPDRAAFSQIRSESVDCAVMENTTRGAMVTAEMDWSDIGTWQSLQATREKDSSGNSVRGPAQLIDCRDVLVDSDGPRVNVIGLEGVIVVVDGDEIVISRSDAAANVSEFAAERSQGEG